MRGTALDESDLVEVWMVEEAVDYGKEDMRQEAGVRVWKKMRKEKETVGDYDCDKWKM